MTEKEALEFIETMEEIGDVWELNQVMDVYGSKSLDEALADRKASVGLFGNIVNTVLNR